MKLLLCAPLRPTGGMLGGSMTRGALSLDCGGRLSATVMVLCNLLLGF